MAQGIFPRRRFTNVSTQTGMTETTVYRTLEFLAGNGVVTGTQVGGGHLAYELVWNTTTTTWSVGPAARS